MKAAATTTSEYFTSIYQHTWVWQVFDVVWHLLSSYGNGWALRWGKQRSPSVLDRTGQQFRLASREMHAMHRKINGNDWESGAHFRITTFTTLLSLCVAVCCKDSAQHCATEFWVATVASFGNINLFTLKLRRIDNYFDFEWQTFHAKHRGILNIVIILSDLQKKNIHLTDSWVMLNSPYRLDVGRTPHLQKGSNIQDLLEAMPPENGYTMLHIVTLNCPQTWPLFYEKDMLWLLWLWRQSSWNRFAAGVCRQVCRQVCDTAGICLYLIRFDLNRV